MLCVTMTIVYSSTNSCINSTRSAGDRIESRARLIHQDDLGATANVRAITGAVAAERQTERRNRRIALDLIPEINPFEIGLNKIVRVSGRHPAQRPRPHRYVGVD